MENNNNETIVAQVGTPLSISQSFRDQKQIEAFIRQNNLVKIIEDASATYVNTFKDTKRPEDAFSAVLIKIPFVYADFFDKFIDLLHLAIDEPVQFADSAKYAIYGLIRDFVKLKSGESGLKNIDIDQVHLQIRFIGLPDQPELHFNPSCNLYPTGLSILDGILRAHTELEKFVLQSVWFCATGCARNKIVSESIKAPTCSTCSRQMCEYTKLRVTQHFCLLRIQLIRSVSTPRFYNKIFRSVTVRVKDHTYTCDLDLGSRMESDNALNQTLAALGDITPMDLDKMLEDDMSVTSDSTTDIMHNNAQEFSSQINDSFFENDDLNDASVHQMLNTLEAQWTNSDTKNGSVMLFEDKEIESITINDVTNDVENSISINRECQPVDLTKSISRQSFDTLSIRKDILETNSGEVLPFNQGEAVPSKRSLDKENNNCFGDTETGNVRFDGEKPTTSKADKQALDFQLRFFTQTKSCEAQKNNTFQNISNTCPNVTSHKKNLQDTTLNFERSKCGKTDAQNNNNFSLEFVSPRARVNHNISNVIQNLNQNQKEHETMQSRVDISLQHEVSGTSSPSGTLAPDFGQETTTDPTAIPQSIKRLYDIIKARYSDFAFVYALSAQLCQDRVPMACYVNVKMGLLLSIASCAKNPNVPPIPIIVMGNDSYMANYLLLNIADLADRFVGPVDEVKSIPSSDGYLNHNWIEADPIQLAKGGVYYVGDWTCLKSARSEKIFKDIETSRVFVARTPRIYPLETAIWAHWRAFKYNAKDQQLFNKFVKIFGIPICMDDNNHETLVDFMLKQASTELFESTIDHLSVSGDDMRKFLAIISQRTVDLTPEAMTILQKYFVASRSERPDCLTKQAFGILKQFAESFAKLALRHEVLVVDAIGAIFMCEDFIQHLYGPGMDPPPILEAGHFVGNIDAFIAQFHEWLKGYIDKYFK